MFTYYSQDGKTRISWHNAKAGERSIFNPIPIRMLKHEETVFRSMLKEGKARVEIRGQVFKIEN